MYLELNTKICLVPFQSRAFHDFAKVLRVTSSFSPNHYQYRLQKMVDYMYMYYPWTSVNLFEGLAGESDFSNKLQRAFYFPLTTS